VRVDGREEHALADLHREVVVLAGLVAERAGEPAAARVEDLQVADEPGE
jgi:hypothetical protein